MVCQKIMRYRAFRKHGRDNVPTAMEVIGSGDVTHGNPLGDNAIAVCKSNEVDDLILEQYIQATFPSLETV